MKTVRHHSAQASMAHTLSGSCAGNKVAARNFMRELGKHAAKVTARVERTAPDSKDTASFLRRARAASLKAIGSKFGALAEEEKINILSFALASDARDSHTPESDQGDCPPPLPALLTQDSMSRGRRHMAGVTLEGGSVVLFGALGRVYSRRRWPCLRFRTNDVLLGTSGVGVRICGV